MTMNQPKSVAVNKAANKVNNTVRNASMAVLEQDANEQASLYSPASSEASPMMPPMNANNDLETIREPSSIKGGAKGGSLYAAMSQTAYTLAAPAALLATAALMMKRKTRSVRFKRNSKRNTRR